MPTTFEVGRLPTKALSRAHFSAWCVVSSPLILGLDLTDTAAVDDAWDVVSNPEVIAVNQQWAGHPVRRCRLTAG